MKKILLLSLFLVAIAGLVGATPISCGVLMTPNSATILLSSSCTVNPDPGFFISTLTLTAKDDWTGGAPGTNPTVNYSGILAQSTLVYTAPTFCVVTSTGSNSNPCSVGINPASTITGLNLSTYTVSLSSASNGVSGGSISGASIQLFLDYGETMIPVSGTPEPTTLGLMGGALIGLGFLARRKK